MNIVKFTNHRHNGHLFHYGHFFHDCLMPEVNWGSLNYKDIIRQECPQQTIGVFSKIYKELGVNNIEFNKKDFDLNPAKHAIIKGYNFNGFTHNNVQKFNSIISERLSPKKNFWQDIVIINRSSQDLSNDGKIKGNLNNGSGRRNINSIEQITNEIKKLNLSFSIVSLENKTFKEQIEIFNSAKTIIGNHGAGLCNIVFCSKNSNLIEIGCNHVETFRSMSAANNLNHYCSENNADSVIQCLRKIYK